MIQDQSVDHTHTWRFLDQRFQDIKELGKFSGQVGGGAGSTPLTAPSMGMR